MIVHPAENRLNYRNRIQLHYDLKKEKLGYLDPTTHEIIEVPHCMIGNQEITESLKNLYLEKSWKKLVEKESQKGHIEIYLQKNKAQISINKPYSSGGFTQVNAQMNNILLGLIDKKIDELPLGDNPFILDLFGGNGNLTHNFNKGRVVVVDSFPAKKENLTPIQNFLQIDLFSSNFLEQIHSEIKIKNIDLLILDPPRSGFKGLEEISKTFSVKNILYVSCNPSTLARDLASIKENFKIKEVHLLDFFPSTYHFETLVLLKHS